MAAIESRNKQPLGMIYVGGLTLFESHLHSSGARYTPLSRQEFLPGVD
jgi:hypothetical protein